MPTMGGNELIELLKSLWGDFRVLCISGYTPASMHHQGMVNKEIPFLHKPFSPRNLALKVRETLDLT